MLKWFAILLIAAFWCVPARAQQPVVVGNDCPPGAASTTSTSGVTVSCVLEGTGNRWVWKAGGTGGSGTPAGGANVIQKNNPPGTFAASSMTDDGTKVKFSIDSQFCGPSPYFDIRCYGATSQPSASTTATINGGSSSATLANAQTFANGQGIDIIGAGPGTSLSTPAAPAVAPLMASGPIMTGSVVGLNGAATCHYQVVAVDQLRGRTAASATTTSTVCPNTFGSNSVGISSWSQTNNTVTITLASAKTLTQFGMLTITGDSQISGQYPIATVIDTTHITITVGTDTRNGAQASGGNAGTITWYQGMYMTLPTASGLWCYLIYSDAGGRGSMQLIGATLPQGGSTGDPLYNEFEDYGPTYTIAPSWSTSWAPTTPPVSAKAQDLITTITAGGGSINVTLANSATTSVVGATFQADQTPNFAAAASAVATSETGVLYIPPTSGSSCFVLNEVLAFGIFGSPLSVLQAGTICARDTIQINQAVYWKGSPQVPVSSGQFSFQLYPRITGQNASPVIWDVPNSASSHFSYLSIDNGSQSDSTLFLEEADVAGIPSTSWDHINFNSATTDHTGRQLVVRNLITGGADHFLDWVSFAPSQSGNTTAPAFIHTRTGASYYMTHMFTTKRGFYFGCGGNVRLDWMHNQGNTTPLFWLQNNCGGVSQSTVYASNITFDTTFEPVVNYTSNVNGQVVLETPVNFPVGFPIVVGPGTMGILNTGANLGPNAYGGVNTQQLTGLEITSVQGGVDGIGAVVGASAPTKLINSDLGLGANYQGFVKAPQVQTAPTCTISAGGTVPVSAHTFTIAPVFFGNGEGDLSVSSASCSTTSGNQTTTINWTTVTGAIGYDIYDNGFSIGCSAPFVTPGSTASYVWTGTPVRCGPGSSVTGSSGPTSWSASHVASPTVQGTNGIFNSLTNPTAAPWIWTGPGGSCGTPPTVTSTSGYSFCLGDSTNQTIDYSNNGGPWLQLGAGIVGNGAGPTVAWYLGPNCPTTNTGQCFFTPANTQVANDCTWSNASTTVTCATSHFVSADVGKRVQGYFKTDSFGAIFGCVAGRVSFSSMTTGTLTIAGFTSGTQISLSANPSNSATSNHGCLIWGTPDDSAASAFETAYAAVSAYCPRVMLSAAGYWFSSPHFFTQPTGCAALPSLVGASAGYGNMVYTAGFELEGRGAGVTVIYLGPDFPNGDTCAHATAGITGCFVVPAEGKWRDLQISGGAQLVCQVASSKNLIGIGVGTLENVTLTNMCNQPTSNIVGIKADLLAQLYQVNNSGWGAACLQTTATTGGEIYAYKLACENSPGLQTNNNSVDILSTTPFFPTFTCNGCLLLGAIASPGGMNVVGVAAGAEAHFVNTVFNSCEAASGCTTGGINMILNKGGKVYLTESTFTVNGGNTPVGSLGCSVSGGSYFLEKTNLSNAASQNYFDNGGCTLTDLGGNNNYFSGLAGAGNFLGSVVADGHSIRGACTGTATASQTLGLYGTGPNETLTTCTSTTIGSGETMSQARTVIGLIVSATHAGVNASSGAVTVLKNGVATTATCTIGTGTTCVDFAHNPAFAAGDLISIQFTTQAAEVLAGVQAQVVWQ